MIAIVCIFLIVALLFILDRKDKRLPPGEWGWPIVGCLSKFPWISTLEEARKKHGGIFVYRYGSLTTVYISDYELAKAAFAKLEGSDRPAQYSLMLGSNFKKIGIIRACGQVFVDTRRFTIRHLKDYGFGKTRLCDIVIAESEKLVDEMRHSLDVSCPIPNCVSFAAMNVIMQLVANVRMDQEDPNLHKLKKSFSSVISDGQRLAFFCNFFPWLPRFIPTFIQNKYGFTQAKKNRQQISDLLTPIIEEHSRTLDRESPKDFIDSYLIELDDRKKDGVYSDIDEEHMHMIIRDLLFTGTETTATELRWSLLYLAKHPKIQKELQEEVDSVLGNRTPLFEDKINMPYCEAFYTEVLRHSALLLTGLPHCASEDFELGGYLIPKGIEIKALIYAINYDERYWKKPKEFNPERFLDENRSFKGQKEGHFSFSLGKRACLGEWLARVELFIMITNLVQNFEFLEDPDNPLRLDTNPLNLINNAPYPNKMIIKNRKTALL